MTDEPQVIVRDFLISNLTDPNPSRVGEYVVSDWPQISDLTINHYPRISVIKTSEPGTVFGIGSTSLYQDYHLQINVWVKPDQPLTISSISYEGKSQVIKISRDITEAIRLNWITGLAQSSNKFLVYKQDNMYNPEMDYDKRLWTQQIDITFEVVRV